MLRVLGDSIGSPLESRTLLLAPRKDPCRAEGALRSRCIPSHYSPRILECPRVMTAVTLFECMDGAVTDIGIGPESQRTCQGDSLEGPGGRAPRRPSSRRLYRDLQCKQSRDSEHSRDATARKNENWIPGPSGMRFSSLFLCFLWNILI